MTASCLIVPQATARSWVLSGRPIDYTELVRTGFVTSNVDQMELLKTIAKQAPVQRIQAKRAFLESIHNELDHAINLEKSIGAAALESGDFQKMIGGFTSAKEMGKIVQKIMSSQEQEH